MNAPQHFEIKDGYCCYRLSGHGPLARAAEMVIEVIAYCREQGIPRLLIDTTPWTGHQSPTTFERYDVASAFATAAQSSVKLAMVVRPELMDPEKFEVTVAVNRGLVGNVFTHEAEAVAWLVDPHSR